MKKLNSLQVIRALACVGVITGHSGMTKLGAWGVSVFLVLSGFLMSYVYDDRKLESSFVSNIKFSVKKIKKLYLLHILMLINFLAAFVINHDKFLNDTVSCFWTTIANAALIQAWVPIYSVYFSLNHASWYLSACLFLYFLFPYILSYLRKLSDSKKVFFSACIIYGIMLSTEIFCIIVFSDKDVFHPSYWFTYIFPIFRAGDFYIGCCIGYVFRHHKIHLKAVSATLLEIITFVLIFIAETMIKEKLYPLGTTTLFLPTSVLLVYLFALNTGWISRILTCKPLVLIGDISGHMFLIHMIVIRYFFVEHVPLPLNQWTMTFSFIVVTVIASVFYIKAEKYIVQKLEKHKQRKQEQP